MIYLLILAALYGAAFTAVYFRNARVNGKLDEDPKTSTRNLIIPRQHGPLGKMFRFGLYPASFNACEVIAVHNARVMKGLPSSYSQMVKDFQRAGAMVGLGIFGSNPYLVGRVLRRSGMEYCRLKKGELRGPGVYIVSFWNAGAPWHGLHTVAAFYDGRSFRYCNFCAAPTREELSGRIFCENNYICSYFLP